MCKLRTPDNCKCDRFGVYQTTSKEVDNAGLFVQIFKMEGNILGFTMEHDTKE